LHPQESRFQKVGNLIRKILFNPTALEVTWFKFLARRSAFAALRWFGELSGRLPANAAFRWQYRINYHLRVQAMHRSSIGPIDAPTCLFRTDEFPQASAQSTWGKLAKHLEVIPVGGTHMSILRPPARETLCRQFLKAVNNAATTSLPGDHGGRVNTAA
jgi:thioesterase domain-containing protein